MVENKNIYSSFKVQLFTVNARYKHVKQFFKDDDLLSPDLKPARLGDVLDSLEWLVLLSVEVEPADLKS